MKGSKRRIMILACLISASLVCMVQPSLAGTSSSTNDITSKVFDGLTSQTWFEALIGSTQSYTNANGKLVQADIPVTGNSSFANKTFSLSASGSSSGKWVSTEASYYYVYTPISAGKDFTATARITSGGPPTTGGTYTYNNHAMLTLSNYAPNASTPAMTDGSSALSAQTTAAEFGNFSVGVQPAISTDTTHNYKPLQYYTRASTGASTAAYAIGGYSDQDATHTYQSVFTPDSLAAKNVYLKLVKQGTTLNSYIYTMDASWNPTYYTSSSTTPTSSTPTAIRTAETSSSGTNPLSFTLDSSGNYYLGLAVSGGTFTFDNVKITDDSNGGAILFDSNNVPVPGNPLSTQTIASIEPITLITAAGVTPYMPTLAMAKYSDGSTLALNVTWNSVSSSQYASPGSFTVQGTVDGTSIPAVANVTVVSASSSVGTVSSRNQDVQSYVTNLPFSMPTITLPQFPSRDFNITDYGAVADGVTDNMTAINQAIATASSAGGGRVIVPAGTWLSGPIQLQSNVNLYLAHGSKILFSPDYNKYLQGSTYQPLLQGKQITNVAITGNGVFDGNGQYWRPIKKSKMTSLQWSNLIASGGVLSSDAQIWYPSPQMMTASRPALIDVRSINTLLIDGPTFQNAPGVTVSNHYSQGVVIRNSTINDPWWGQNNDGMDNTSSQGVVIYNNTVNSGDDGIAMKSGGSTPSATNATSGVVVADNIVFHAHGGFVVGSNISGGINNIMVENNQYVDTDYGIKMKSDVGDGGPVENIYINGINMQNIASDAIHFDTYYDGDNTASQNAQPGDAWVPEYKNIHISNVAVNGAGNYAVYIWALPHVPMHDAYFTNVKINSKLGFDAINAYNFTLTNVQITPSSGPVYTLTNCSNFVYN